MFDLLFDLYQQRRINDVETTSQDTNRKATASHERIRQLEESVARLALLNAAMWSLLKDRTGLTDAVSAPACATSTCETAWRTARSPPTSKPASNAAGPWRPGTSGACIVAGSG